ncbi:MAG: glucan biosynthesis protein G [Pseudomonadota bacterium]
MKILKMFQIHPSVVILVSLALTTQSLDLAAKMPKPFSQEPLLQTLILQAKEDATKPFKERVAIDDEALLSMDYQTYRSIRFNTDKSLWKDSKSHELQFFHGGFFYDKPVKINVINEEGEVNPFAFDTQLFNYDSDSANIPEASREKAGYAGFRVHYPINNDQYKDEYAVFQGASYFRLIGKNQNYGLSARALAIDTGLPSGEEFPYFSEFWLQEPENETLTIYARIDSQSLTGMTSITLAPGDPTQAEVKTWVFVREPITKLGFAAFTSMYFFGENTTDKPDDFRREVHDSDGVSMITHAGEQIWRPLANPDRVRISSLFDAAPKGFGVLQRDLDFEHYLDAEAFYHRRPGLWLTPHEGFENGHLELVEIPTESEFDDNIVAYWVSDNAVEAGDSTYVHYTLETIIGHRESNNELIEVVRTLQSASTLPGEPKPDNPLEQRFIVDFDFPTDMDIDQEALSADLQVSLGESSLLRVFPINDNQQIRATFIIAPETEDSVVDMRLALTQKDKRLSETWNYQMEPKVD